MGRLKKSFSVFDCDAHIDDPIQIWNEYVAESDRDLVRVMIPHNGEGADPDRWAPSYNPIRIAGPQMSKPIIRRLQTMVPLTAEQRDYVECKGAFDPHERIKEMDLMGIDQVLVIPTLVIATLPMTPDPRAANAFTRGYNRWVQDWCAAVPDRLFGAGLLPPNPAGAAVEAAAIAADGLPVALLRPIEGASGYPNDIAKFTSPMAPQSWDATFKVLEEAGVCLGMHTFPGGPGSPGQFLSMAGINSQTLSFVFEAQTWLGQILLSGFLDRYPDLKMLVFESNSEWLPFMLDECDMLFKLYAKERRLPATRLPSDAFYEQCMISFESDEETTFHQWEQFQDIGIWASDCYHHDGADSWSAMRAMDESGVPAEVQAKLLGENARRFYGIEEKLFVTEEPAPIDRPDWFPQGDDFDEWSRLVAHPRRNADRLRELGFNLFGYPEGINRGELWNEAHRGRHARAGAR
jgi:predicted TIM-barrel fold metal-dependent hydrolase